MKLLYRQLKSGWEKSLFLSLPLSAIFFALCGGTVKKRFSATIIAQTAMLSAFAYLLLLSEVAIFASAPHLRLNFSDLPALIGGFAFGPLVGVIITTVKILLFMLTGTSTALGIGDLANFLLGLGFVLPATFIYRRKKTFKNAIIALVVGSVSMIVTTCLTNYFITLPFFSSGQLSGSERITLILTIYLPFNVIKAVATSVLTALVYKPISKVLRLLDTVDGIKKYTSRSTEQTEELAINLAKKCVGGEVILIEGEMGSGKTVFAKGFAKGLGVVEQVTSPTFAIHNIYEGKFTLHHFDFYRIDSLQAENLGLNEFFGEKNSVCILEWSENIKDLIPPSAKRVKIIIDGETERTVKIL